VDGGGGAAGGRVPSGPVTCRTLFTLTLHWISLLSSTLAVFFFMAVVADGGGVAGGGLPSGPATGRSLFTFTLRWISRLSSTLGPGSRPSTISLYPTAATQIPRP
jgi:hypothetical protein